MQTPTPARGQWGFNIVELVVVVAIISILALILVPVVSNRAQQARIASAEQEVMQIADAMERTAIDTTFFFRLYVLDDVPGGDGQPNEGNAGVIDGIRDIGLSNLHTTPERIFINSFSQDFDNNFIALFDRFRTNETAFGWRGPYLNWKRDANLNDWPDDPWGNDYLFFTRIGGLFPAPLGDQDDEFVTTAPSVFSGFDADPTAFDRPTILSMGPDGLPGNAGVGGWGRGDDIFAQIGGQFDSDAAFD